MLDLNHPLAGQQLIVTLQIMTIENPNEVGPPTIRGHDNHHELVMVAPRRGLSPPGSQTKDLSTLRILGRRATTYYDTNRDGTKCTHEMPQRRRP